MKKTQIKFLLIITTLTLFGSFSFSSDHIDGPITTKHGIADISDLYAFPTPNENKKLSLVLNTHPFVSSRGHFSEKVNYVFLLKKAKIIRPLKQITTYDETQITCSFQKTDGNDYNVTCKLDSKLDSKKLSVKTKVGEESLDGDFKLFAGMASDPFFLNKDWVKAAIQDGKLITPNSKNALDKLNVLSIVMDIEIEKIFDSYSDDELIAVAAKSITKTSTSSNWKQLDWVGRPEITNFSLIAPHGEHELRDRYNGEEPFKRPFKYGEAYFDRLHSNIKDYYDQQDGVINWSEDNLNKAVSLLMGDYLLLSLNLPCHEDSFFRLLSYLF